MSYRAQRTFDNRVKTLQRRRDYLDTVITDYKGNNSSRSRAERSAIDWALVVIMLNVDSALESIETEKYLTKDDAVQKGGISE